MSVWITVQEKVLFPENSDLKKNQIIYKYQRSSEILEK